MTRRQRFAILLTCSTLAFPSLAAAASADAAATSGDSGAPTWSVQGPTAPDDMKFTDISSAYTWARSAINYVGNDRIWMQDYGTDTFRPGLAETRKLFARAMVRAFADAGELTDPSITFTDLASDDPFFRFANLSVKHGWMSVKDGAFLPDDPVTIVMVYRGLVHSLPLADEEAALTDIHSADGYRFVHPTNFPTTELGMRLGLRYNHSEEGRDLLPTEPMPRAEVAYALWRRATVPQYTIDGLSSYIGIELPTLDDAHRQVVEFGLKYIGFSYIWGGEWETKRAGQPQGGFDCSGLMWWTVKKPGDGFDNTGIRGYAGWRLPQRASADMASVGKHLKYANTKPGDLMFYDGDSSGSIDHVDLYLGNGWALDSSSGVGGVTILRVASGWYRDHYKWSRHLGT